MLFMFHFKLKHGVYSGARVKFVTNLWPNLWPHSRQLLTQIALNSQIYGQREGWEILNSEATIKCPLEISFSKLFGLLLVHSVWKIGFAGFLGNSAAKTWPSISNMPKISDLSWTGDIWICDFFDDFRFYLWPFCDQIGLDQIYNHLWPKSQMGFNFGAP